MTNALFYLGNAVDVLGTLPEGEFSTTVTSIPFWGRRTYSDDPNEIGKDQTIAEYIADLRCVFDAVKTRMRPDGILWVNSGDTISGSGGAGGDYSRESGPYATRTKYRQGKPIYPDGWRVPNGQWCNIPALVAESLMRDGWLLRSKIVWNKNVVRHSAKAHERRPGEQHEMIFMFSQRRASEYRYFHQREIEPGDVWTFPPARGKGNGKAPFPLELPRRCILTASEPHDAVLDPFCGAGTTLIAAADLNRVGVGIDLDTDALISARQRDARILPVVTALDVEAAVG